MTREEALNYAIVKVLSLEHGRELVGDECKSKFQDELDFYHAVIRNLCPITREQVEKAFPGCSWCNNEGKRPENWECSILDDRGFSVVVGDEVVWTNAEFCPVCGRPLTDEAVDMVVERLEEMQND